MTAFAVVVDLYDNRRPSCGEDGTVYAGETRLFVLSGETLAAALERLVGAIEAQDSYLQQVHAAGPVSDFDDERYTFDVDLEAMARDAAELGEICVSPDYPFATYPAPSTGVFWGLFDIFDPSRLSGQEPYAGEFRWAAARGTHAGDAMRKVLANLVERGCGLKSVDDLAHVVFFDRETPVDGRTLEEAADSLGDGPDVIWADGASMYAEDSNG